jgi:hypothetical protein
MFTHRGAGHRLGEGDLSNVVAVESRNSWRPTESNDPASYGRPPRRLDLADGRCIPSGPRLVTRDFAQNMLSTPNPHGDFASRNFVVVDGGKTNHESSGSRNVVTVNRCDRSPHLHSVYEQLDLLLRGFTAVWTMHPTGYESVVNPVQGPRNYFTGRSRSPITTNAK